MQIDEKSKFPWGYRRNADGVPAHRWKRVPFGTTFRWRPVCEAVKSVAADQVIFLAGDTEPQRACPACAEVPT